MNLNDLLIKHGISPNDVLILRHRPIEPILRRALPWLAAERPDLYNAYQQAQFPAIEKAYNRAKYIASFVGLHAGSALFAGLYQISGSRRVGIKEFGEIAANKELCETYGMTGLSEVRTTTLWFDLILSPDFYANWHGRLIVRWPGGERSWWRWANKNTLEIDAILETSAFEQTMPPWNDLVVPWRDLKILPTKWKASLNEWRGIYYIHNSSTGRGYVGAAYGSDNILGRWLQYGKTGHGGNKELRNCTPEQLVFSILERVSPDLPPPEVIRLENSWKRRLHTREFGMNEN